MNEVNKVIDSELQKKLNKITGLTVEHNFLYTPKVYREALNEAGDYIIPKEEWPVFKLKGKNGIEIAEAEDNSGYVETGTSKLVLTSGKARIETLKKHILSWKNFKDREGNDIPCTIKNGEVYHTCLMRLPADLQRELHEAINEQSILSPEELEGLEF